MFNISVEKKNGCIFDLNPMSAKRDWMDKTSEKHAYKCLPVTLANTIGWNLSCTQDIIFTWDGINDQSPDHIKISSPKYAHAGRGQSTISFDTQLIFRTDVDVSIWIINPVNFFNNDFEIMSSLVSTSFYDNTLPLAIRAKRINEETVIKSGTAIASIIPISLSSLNHTTIKVNNYFDQGNLREKAASSYGAAAHEINTTGKFTDWYKDAVNEKNHTLGSHEVKALRLNVEYKE